MKTLHAALLSLFWLCAASFAYGATGPKDVAYSTLRRLADDGEIVSAQIPVYGNSVRGHLKDGSEIRALISDNQRVADLLVAAGVETRFVLPADKMESGIASVWRDIAMDLIPFLIFLVFVGFVVFAMKGWRQAIDQQTEAFFQRLEKCLAANKV